MSVWSRLSSFLRSSPAAGAKYLDDRLSAIEDSVAGLAADGTFTMSSAAAFKPVYVSAANTVALADADDTAKNSPVGFTVSAPTGSTAVVRFCGIVTAAGSFTAGAVQYLSATAGALTETSPNAPYGIPVAIAINTTDLLILPSGLLAWLLRGLTTKTGANVIGYDDSGSKTTAASVGDALDEIFLHIVNGGGVIELKPSDFYLKTGAPLAIFANGASAVPGMVFVDSKALGIRWNNNATQDAVTTSYRVPADMNITANAGLRVICSKTNNTLADATTFDIEAFNQVLAALHDADGDYGGTSAAITGDAAAKTIQSSALTLLAANLAAHPASTTITVKPTDGTLATDDLVVHGVYILYTKKATS